MRKFLMRAIVCPTGVMRNSLKKRGLTFKPTPSKYTGADVGIRTPDLLITNQLLYQLSYIGLLSFLKGNI